VCVELEIYLVKKAMTKLAQHFHFHKGTTVTSCFQDTSCALPTYASPTLLHVTLYILPMLQNTGQRTRYLLTTAEERELKIFF
jgi:hypothetical protein